MFNFEERIPARHLLRWINPIVTRVLADLREKLKPFYSETGRPSIDPELMLRMLIVGYCHGIRFERKLCEEIELRFAYRWFCRLAPDDKVPNHITYISELSKVNISLLDPHVKRKEALYFGAYPAPIAGGAKILGDQVTSVQLFPVYLLSLCVGTLMFLNFYTALWQAGELDNCIKLAVARERLRTTEVKPAVQGAGEPNSTDGEADA